MIYFKQLRLDFETFVITGPSSDTTTVGVVQLGTGTLVEGEDEDNPNVTLASQCLTDQFNVLSNGCVGIPTICGINNGEHCKYFRLQLYK